ncbi:hypothetical protein [Urechidicola croceus]|uniref:Uncharacterized protein n=1 Tax=Urechidicola croceus TaxID=1850246 RepID=A0A1D8P7Y9_9FLAO|nr:hypothetical protein [Urechidicola croceus]AOW20683.1 hypothetical protein LPB138_08340 [Urechidicola croceus]
MIRKKKRSPEDMHFDSLQWISELKFINDEQKFFNHLLKVHYKDSKIQNDYPEILELVTKLSSNKKVCQLLMSNIEKHNNELDVLLDDVNQPFEEKKVMADHNGLIDEVETFLHNYKELKMNIFIIIIDIMKNNKE